MIKKGRSGRMDTTSIDTTIRRVQEIESRLNSLFGTNNSANTSSDSSFGNVLNNKINLDNYFNKVGNDKEKLKKFNNQLSNFSNQINTLYKLLIFK